MGGGAGRPRAARTPPPRIALPHCLPRATARLPLAQPGLGPPPPPGALDPCPGLRLSAPLGLAFSSSSGPGGRGSPRERRAAGVRREQVPRTRGSGSPGPTPTVNTSGRARLRGLPAPRPGGRLPDPPAPCGPRALREPCGGLRLQLYFETTRHTFIFYFSKHDSLLLLCKANQYVNEKKNMGKTPYFFFTKKGVGRFVLKIVLTAK